MIQDHSWKKRLYHAYVSSGQAQHEAPSENAFQSRAPSIKSVLKEHVPPDKQLRILDLGCGNGAFLHFLKLDGYQRVQGVDVSAEQVAIAHKLGISEVKHDDLNSCLEHTESSSVDVVFLMDILEHLTRPELFDALDEVFRILQPGGRCIAHVPNAEGLFGMRIRYGDLTHEQAFTPRSVKQLFSTIGFRAVQCHEDKPVIHNLKSTVRRIIWDVFTLVPRLLMAAETGETRFVLSQNMLIVAKK